MQTSIDFEDVLKIYDTRAFINSKNLEDIDLIVDGVKVEISEKELEEWKFIGLSNFDFLMHKGCEQKGIKNNVKR